MLRRSLGLLLTTVLVASCAGVGDESSSGRLRNTAADCFPTEADRIAALKSAISAANAAEANRASKGDEQVLTTAFSNADSEYERVKAELNDAQRLFAEANGDYLAGIRAGHNSASSPEHNKWMESVNRYVEAGSRVKSLSSSVNQAFQVREAANQALDGYRAAKKIADQAIQQMNATDATPVCVAAEAVATTGAETSIDAAGETTTSVALETSTTIDGSTETTLLADENSATTIEVVPTTAVSDQATVDDASTTTAPSSTTAPSTTIVDSSSETCADSTVLTPPDEVVVGEKFWLGLQGCTAEIWQRAGVRVSLWGTNLSECPNWAGSVNGIDGTYFECAITTAGTETFNLGINKDGERIRESAVFSVFGREAGGDVCRGQSPNGEIDSGSRTASVRYTCEKSTGLRIQALVDTPTGTAVVQTWLNQTSRRFDNLSFGNVLESYPKVKFVATHMCDDKDGRPRVVCGDPTLWSTSEPPVEDATKPTTSATNPCLDPANPKYNCGWAMVDDNGTVTNAIVCSFEVCGTGAFAGTKVVLQTRQEPSGNVAGWSQGKYDASTNRFYPFGIPGPWFTGGDEWSDIRASLEATSVPMTTSTTVAPAATSTTVATTAASAQPTSSEPTMVVTPLPASALQREDESVAATDNRDESGADTPLPIPVPDRATEMICDAQCVSDARSQAGADENATVEIEVADGLWIPAENAMVPVIPDGVSLKFRVTPSSGTAVLLGGQVASASVVLEKASQSLVTTSSDGSVEDSAGNIIGAVQNVGSVKTQQSGFSTLLAFILAVFALITALLIAFLVKFFLKSRSSASAASDHSDREGKV